MDDDAPQDDPDGEGDLGARIREREERMRRLKSQLDRADAAQRMEKRERITSSAKLVALSVGVLLVLAGGVWGVNQLAGLVPDNACKFHEHATFRVFDRGQELGFQHPRFDMRHMAMRAHLHQPNDYQIHLEGGCADVAEFFGLMGMEIRPGHLRLDQELHGGGALADDGNDTLRFYLYHEVEGNWTWQEYDGLLGHQLRDRQRMLITYGNLTDEEVAYQQSRVPAVPMAG
jgi:hypothetical protein